MRHVRAKVDSPEQAAAFRLVIALSIVLEDDLATLAHQERMQATDPAILLGSRKALTDLLR